MMFCPPVYSRSCSAGFYASAFPFPVIPSAVRAARNFSSIDPTAPGVGALAPTSTHAQTWALAPEEMVFFESRVPHTPVLRVGSWGCLCSGRTLDRPARVRERFTLWEGLGAPPPIFEGGSSLHSFTLSLFDPFTASQFTFFSTKPRSAMLSGVRTNPAHPALRLE
jgi:hypothetical protein